MIMAECGEVDDLSARQGRLLIQSLATMKVPGKADVILICGGKKFYAHKVVLEARSSYFTTMFQSNLEEAKSGTIFFKDMKPETLDAILDFLYLGDVKKVNTDEQLMNVLKASHVMELKDLFQYCCTNLILLLSPQNFFAIWSLAEKYEAEKMFAQVKSYFLGNSTQILASNEFLAANVNQLKDLVVFFKSKVRNVDRMLKGMVLWVLHDLPTREQFVGELFAYIDANHVSKEFAKSLLNECQLVTTSKKLANRLKDLVIEVCFVEGNELSEGVENDDASKIITNLKICGYKLFVLQQQDITTAADETVKSTCIQVFDLDTMTWKPKKHLTCVNFKVEAICQYNTSIFLVGSSAGNLYVLNDLKSDTLQYVKTKNNLSRPNAGACYFRDFIYLVGGTAGDSKVSVCLKPGDNNWEKTSPLKHSRNKPVLFKSDTHMFVAGGLSSISKQFVEYTDGTKNLSKVGDGVYFYEMNWTVAELPKDFMNTDVHFFPYNNQLSGVYNSNGVFVKLMCQDGNWHVNESPKKLRRELNLSSISHFPTATNPFLLISTTDSIDGTPNYVLEMASLEWTKLPEPRGVCGMKEGESFLTTMCYLP